MIIIFTPPDFTFTSTDFDSDSTTYSKLSDSIISAAFNERNARIPSGWINKLYKSKDNQVLIYEIVFISETEACPYRSYNTNDINNNNALKVDVHDANNPDTNTQIDNSIIAANTQFIPIKSNTQMSEITSAERCISSQPDCQYIYNLYAQLNLTPISTFISEHAKSVINSGQFINVFGVIFDMDGIHSLSLSSESENADCEGLTVKYSTIFMFDFDLKLRVQIKLWRHFSKWIGSFSKGSRVQIRNLRVSPSKYLNSAFELSTTSTTEMFLLGGSDTKNTTLSYSRLNRLTTKEQEILSFLNYQSLLISTPPKLKITSNSSSNTLVNLNTNVKCNISVIPLNIEMNSSSSLSGSGLWKLFGSSVQLQSQQSSSSSVSSALISIEFKYFNAIIWSNFCTLLHHNNPKSLSSYLMNFQNLTPTSSASASDYIFSSSSSVSVELNSLPHSHNNNHNNNHNADLFPFNWNHFSNSKVILFGFYKVSNCFISNAMETTASSTSHSFDNSFTKFTCNSVASQTQTVPRLYYLRSYNEDFSFLIENTFDEEVLQKIRDQSSFILFVKSELNADNYEELTHKTIRIIL